VHEADDALIRAWNLCDDHDDGWSDAVMAEAERLLPILIDAGYAKTKDATWNFTPKGIARACSLNERGRGIKLRVGVRECTLSGGALTAV
jgi:hypothetical protein